MRVYFLGIGGVSMSALAIMLQNDGVEVSGSDVAKGRATEILEAHGISVDFNLNFEAISKSDLIVASSAIKSDDPRIMYAQKTRKKIISRGQLLGKISEGYENVIAVAGSHGKTTTTAMIYEILKVVGKKPTLHLGGLRIDDGKNYEIGGKEFFVTEACEYCDNFLHLHPTLAVVTNIEKDHMDYFHTFSREMRSFEKFKQNSRYFIDSVCQVSAKNVHHEPSGNLIFDLCTAQKRMELRLQVCEDVNTQNAIFAYLACRKLGICDDLIKIGLENFKGVKSRFERMNCPRFECCICDYAHHPTEISKAISTMKKIFKGKNLVVIFQPHTFSRTKNLLREFLNVFRDVPYVGIFKTYSAREKEEDGISGEKLAKIMQKTRKNVQYFENFAILREFLENFPKKDTSLLFVGAGDLPSIAQSEGFFE